jgi:hypothetical protein
MIQPLRAVHRRAFVALAFVLPAILLVGLGGRRPRPQAGENAAQAPASANLVKKSDNLWHAHSITTEFSSDSSNPPVFYVVLRPAQPLNEPDLLLYWSAREPQGNMLPDEVRLLGAFAAGKTSALPLDRAQPGYLVLYSGAHQAVVDSALVEKLP